MRLSGTLDVALVLSFGIVLRFNPFLPGWLRDATGGMLYVCLIAIVVREMVPAYGSVQSAAAALGFTCMVECAQLWHPTWLDAVRATLPGRLALGSTFSWWDFPPYLAGAILAAIWLRRRGAGL